MKIKFFALMVFAMFAGQGVWAQDDMYFTPKKKAKSQSVVTSDEVDADAPYRYRIPSETDNEIEDYGGSGRDVDEYNRRGTSYGSTPQSHYEAIDADDSITISREEYEDFVNSRNMQRFDGYSGLSVVYNDPWYYDSWYWDDPYYSSWRWNSSWYYPWYSSYSWYDPWYRYSYWGWRYGGYYNGWYGHYAWHRPYYGHRYWGGYTNYRRGGYVNGRSISHRNNGGGYGGYRHNSGRTGNVRNPRNSSSSTNSTPTSVRRNSFGTNSSSGGYMGNSRGYSNGSSSSSRSNSSFGSSSSSSMGNSSSGSFGGSTRSSGGGFSSGGGSRGGGGSHGGGRR